MFVSDSGNSPMQNCFLYQTEFSVDGGSGCAHTYVTETGNE